MKYIITLEYWFKDWQGNLTVWELLRPPIWIAKISSELQIHHPQLDEVIKNCNQSYLEEIHIHETRFHINYRVAWEIFYTFKIVAILAVSTLQRLVIRQIDNGTGILWVFWGYIQKL